MLSPGSRSAGVPLPTQGPLGCEPPSPHAELRGGGTQPPRETQNISLLRKRKGTAQPPQRHLSRLIFNLC